jgi:hypothetical protein
VLDVLRALSLLEPGLAKLGHHPGEAFMELLVGACVARRLRDFNPQELANTINGEARMAISACVGMFSCGSDRFESRSGQARA